MRKILKALAAVAIANPTGAIAGSLMLMGVGAVTVSAMFTTPANVPQPTSFFSNGNGGALNNGLKIPATAFEPPTTPTHSFGILLDGSVSPGIPVLGAAAQYAFGNTTAAPPNFKGLFVSGNSNGLPTVYFQKLNSIAVGWWQGSGYDMTGAGATSSGTVTSYNNGYYPFTASPGSNCIRPPSGVFGGIGNTQTQDGAVDLSDPGFQCPTATISLVNIPGSGAQQATLASSPGPTTCAPNSPVTGNFTVTTNVTVPHLFTPGQTYTLSGFTPSGYNTTYIALSGTTGTTLVGMPSTATTGTCPTSPATAEGTFSGMNGGGGGTITLPATSTIGATGFTTIIFQRFCALITENGDDSPFPGSQAVAMVDDHGNPLPGAPSLISYLNQGTANFTGYTVTGAQSVGNLSLHVTAMNPYTITGATWAAASGNTPAQVTFTTATTPMFEPGSEFTVTGMTPTGYNQTYVAVAPLTTTGTTITATPLSGPLGTPQALANPGSFVSGGSMVSVIMPGMRIEGQYLPATLGVISPFGTLGGTGTGGVGTYATSVTPVTVAFGITIPSTGTLTLTALAGTQQLAIGTNFNGSDGLGTTNVQITGFGTGTGTNPTFNGTYKTNYTGGGTFTSTVLNGVGTVGSPVTLFAVNPFYQTMNGIAGTLPGSPSTGYTTVPVSQTNIGDFATVIGTEVIATVPGSIASPGWSGNLGDVAMLYMPGATSASGGFPTQTGGAPSTSALAGLCKKNPTNDIQQFATAEGFTVHSLYRLNKPGIFGDSSNATIQGYVTNSSGTNATLNVVSTTYGSLALPTGTETADITGVGLPVASPATIPLTTSSSSTYAMTPNTTSAVGSIGSPVEFDVGAFAPGAPLPTSAVEGWIDDPGSVPTLHVNSVTSSSPNNIVTFTGTLNFAFTAKIDNGSGAAGNILTVTAPAIGNNGLLANPYIGIGTTITIPGGSPATDTVAGFGTGGGITGTYTMTHSQASVIASTTMHASGLLPGQAANLTVSGVTGAISAGMLITDGGTNITGPPLLTVGGVTAGDVPIVPTYYPTFTSSSGALTGTLSTIVPGQYVLNSAITTPTKVIGYGSGVGLLGSYPLSACPNAACTVGSSGTPTTVFTTTGITDAAPVATPALTVRDLGPGTTLRVTSNMSSCTFASCSATGTVPLSGTFDTSALGGIPTTIQAQVSETAGGPPIPGCSACAWTTLSSYTAAAQTFTASITTGGVMTPSAATAPTLGIGQAFTGSGYSGTVTAINTLGQIPTYSVTPSPGSAVGPETMTSTNVLSWSGNALSIPASCEPLYVSVRASNGTAYAMLQNPIRIGIVVEVNGEGQLATLFSGGQGGNSFSTFNGCTLGITNNGSGGFFQAGPPIAGALIPGSGISAPAAIDRFGVTGIGNSEGSLSFEQGVSTAMGVPTWWATVLRDGIGIEPLVYGNAPQTQTIGVQNSGGTLSTWCSQATFCNNPSVAKTLLFNGASLTGGQIVASINNGTAGTPGNILTLSVNGTFTGQTTAGVMNVTATPTNMLKLTVGTVISGSGVPAGTTISSLGTGTGGIGTYNLSNVFTQGSPVTTTGTIARGASIWGALEPGAVLTDITGNITGSPQLLNCITGCVTVATTSPTVPFYCGSSPCYLNNQTWAITGSAQSVSQETMFADTPQSGGTPWALSSNQGGFPLFTTFGYVLIKAGTFAITYTDPTTGIVTNVCKDTSVPLTPYNNQGFNCTDSSGHNLAWVDSMTDDYVFTPLSNPPANAVITASWVDLISPDDGTLLYQRPSGYDFFGDGTPKVGAVASALSFSPAGVSAHIFAGGQGLQGILLKQGYPYGVPYSREISWLYATRFPRDIPGNSPNSLALFGHVWGVQGPVGLTNLAADQVDTDEGNLFSQWIHDVATPSTFSGTVGSVSTAGATGVLTLSGAATGQMWEGEVIGCNPFTVGCALGTGTYIQSLCTAALCGTASSSGWGVSGSTYFITSISTAAVHISTISSAIPMTNAMYYTGAGGGFNVGPYNDQNIQGGGLNSSGGVGPHGGSGQQGMGRIGRRMGCLTWGALTNTANCSAPYIDRTKADATGCDTSATTAPCFDIGNTFATTATPTAVSGTPSVLTLNGLAAHTIPISDGQLVSCSGCATGLFVVSLSNPPTADARAGQGQWGSANNGFTVTLSGSLTGWTSGKAVTFGCSGTAGTGSNCVDIAYTIPTTNGTYGTAPALATCGENNANGNAPYNTGGFYGNGVCQTNGIGSLVRNFAIGSNQQMWTGAGTTPIGATYYDDGLEPPLISGGGSTFNQSAAFACHIVAADVIQCVLGPTYSFSAGVLTTTIGQWPSGSTFVEQGDYLTGNSRINTLMGYVGGQSFPITSPGSGQTPNIYATVKAPFATASSATYTSSTGIVSMTFATAPYGSNIGSILNGQNVTISNFLPSGTNTAILGAGGTAVLPIVSTASAGTVINLQAATGLGTLSITNGTGVFSACGENLGSLGGLQPAMDLMVGNSGTIINAYVGAAANSFGIANNANNSNCTFLMPASAGGTPGFITVPYGAFEGFGGFSTPANDNNLKSIGPYDNTMIPGNPLAPFQAFCTTASGYCEPGLAAEPFGLFLGAMVSG